MTAVITNKHFQSFSKIFFHSSQYYSLINKVWATPTHTARAVTLRHVCKEHPRTLVELKVANKKPKLY